MRQWRSSYGVSKLPRIASPEVIIASFNAVPQFIELAVRLGGTASPAAPAGRANIAAAVIRLEFKRGAPGVAYLRCIRLRHVTAQDLETIRIDVL